MLADQLDYIVGVDPHRDSHALAVVEVVSGAVVFEATIDANSDGYARALELAELHAPGRRAFAIEGIGSFGAGLTRFLTGREEWVLEVGRLRRERRSGGKSDALDAIRAARSVLSQQRPSTPRAGGERQALQALVAAREGAVNAKRSGLCQLRDLLITTPEPLRSELRPLTRAGLLERLAATRPHGRPDAELRGSLLALRSIARRVLALTAEERELAREIETLTRRLAPQLLDQPASDRTPPRSSSSPGHTAAGSNRKPRSRDSPAQHRYPPPPERRSATASTEAATENSTVHCT
jgi:transposase